MDKIQMREWISILEGEIDDRLKTWKKESRIENGEAVQIEWQFEQTHVLIDIFWRDGMESAHLKLFSPRSSYSFIWHGLTDQTYHRIMDRVGNLTLYMMNPPIEPKDLHNGPKS